MAFCSMASKVSLVSTKNWLDNMGWSERFRPTLGRLTMVLIPREDRAVLSPIPDSIKIWGVFTDPADRMISFLAVTT